MGWKYYFSARSYSKSFFLSCDPVDNDIRCSFLPKAKEFNIVALWGFNRLVRGFMGQDYKEEWFKRMMMVMRFTGSWILSWNSEKKKKRFECPRFLTSAAAAIATYLTIPSSFLPLTVLRKQSLWLTALLCWPPDRTRLWFQTESSSELRQCRWTHQRAGGREWGGTATEAVIAHGVTTQGGCEKSATRASSLPIVFFFPLERATPLNI